MTNPAAAQNQEIDCLSPEAQRLAEARLAAKRAARAEAREIRMKELERQQKEVEERPEKDFTEKGSRSLPGLSAATLASLGGTSSRRGSGDTSISIDTEASIREIKDSLAEVEEKYKKAMVSNAQLDNEKTNFMYQVDTLKDMLLELEEQLAESRRQYEEKSKGFPSGSAIKNPPANAGDMGSIPRSGSSPAEGNGNPLQYSCLENPVDRGAWWATVQRVAKASDLT